MISHENIIKIFEVYEDQDYVHLVLEYLKGGELFQHIMEKGVYDEQDAVSVMKNLLNPLKYIHLMGIIHRDLKPENLILSDSSNQSVVKIADFGLATIMNGNEPESNKCGSPGYVGTNII